MALETYALLSLHRINGLLVPDYVKQEEVDKLKDFQLYPDDVWVVTYPKCGTTWTQQIVRLIRNNGVQDGVKIDFAIPWPEGIAQPHVREANFSLDKLKQPRAFKSHFPYHLLPCGPPNTTPCKYIYVARNPKDAAVSLYFHARERLDPPMEWDDFWKMYKSGDMVYGNYFDHLLSWLPHKDDKKVLFLKYEDMKRNLPGAVSQIASFLGVELSSDVITKIVDLTSFDKMKQDDTANYSWWRPFHQEKGGSKFMRKGTIGDWKNHFTAEQSVELDAIIAEKLGGTGLDFQYE